MMIVVVVVCGRATARQERYQAHDAPTEYSVYIHSLFILANGGVLSSSPIFCQLYIVILVTYYRITIYILVLY